ncbi:hypothetical protein R0J92_25635, partial [Tritonibacter sp. SIMBA_163]
GGMVWALTNGYRLEDAFRLGVAAGAATVMSPGTELCRREDVFTLYEHGDAAFRTGKPAAG